MIPQFVVLAIAFYRHDERGRLTRPQKETAPRQASGGRAGTDSHGMRALVFTVERGVITDPESWIYATAFAAWV